MFGRKNKDRIQDPFDDLGRDGDGVLVKPPARRGRHLPGCLVSLLALLLILYVFILIAGRTEGFRSFAAQYVLTHYGLNVRIASSGVSPSLSVVLKGIRTPGDKRDTEPGVQVEELRIEGSFWRWLGGRGWIERVELAKGSVVFVESETGWEPSGLAEWAGLLDQWTSIWKKEKVEKPAEAAGESDKDDPTSHPMRLPSVRVRGLDLKWIGIDASEKAAVERMDLDFTPLRVPGRDFMHVRITARSLRKQTGENFPNFNAEFMAFDTRRLLIDLRIGGVPQD